MASRLQDVLLRGLFSARPAANTVAPGTLYYSTDTATTDQSNGTIWQTFSDISLAVSNSLPMLFMEGNDGLDGFPIQGPAGPSGSSGGLTPAISLTQSAAPGTLNVTTEGTVDWLAQNGNGNLPRSNMMPSKALGGPLMLGFDWIVNGGTIFTGSGGIAITNSAGDSIAPDLSGVSNYQGVNKASGINFGFRLFVPAEANQSRRLRIYAATFSAELTVTASLPGLAPLTSTIDPGAGVSVTKLFEVNFNGYGVLRVTGLATINHGSTPNISFLCATLF